MPCDKTDKSMVGHFEPWLNNEMSTSMRDVRSDKHRLGVMLSFSQPVK